MALAAACTVGIGTLAACAPGGSVAGNCTLGTAAGSAAGLGTAGAAAKPSPLTAVPDQTSRAPAASLPPRSTVTLVTGDRVRLDVAPDGEQTVNPAGGAAGFVRLSWGGDRFAIPYAAVPYLGRTLDPMLFDVSYLVRAKLDDARSSTLPVTVSGQGADSLPSVKDLHASGLSTTAKVDKGEAPKLGRLLAGRWLNGGTARPAAASPIAQLRLAPPAGAPALPAGLPQAPAAGKGAHFRTLSLNFTGPDGKPAPAIGWVQNVDDSRVTPFVVGSPDVNAFPAPGQEGPVKVSVPDGTYSVAFTILSPHPGSYLGVDAALVVKPEVTVKSDQTITLDARTAKRYQVALDPPVSPTTLKVDTLTLLRTGADGGRCVGGPQAMELVSAEGAGDAASTVAATPTPKVTKGTVGFDAITGIYTDTAAAPSAPQSAPRYFLDFEEPGGGIPASLNYTVPRSDLTTVAAHLYQSPSGGDLHDCTSTATPELYPLLYTFGHSKGLGVFPAVQPGDHTDYWYASQPDQVLWQAAYLSNGCILRDDLPQHIAHGQQITQTWNKAPTVPAAVGPAGLGGARAQIESDPLAKVCPACRQDDNALVNIVTFGDSDPAHYTAYAFEGSDLDFYRDGKLALTGKSIVQTASLEPFGLMLPLLPNEATYRLDWNLHRSGDSDATIHTDWTFHSGRSDPPAAMPANERCAPDPGRACSFLPLLFPRYDLSLNLKSQAPAGGPFDITFAVTGPQGAPAPSGVAATVSASYDGGKTWSDPQDATASGGKFTATVTHPALADTDGFVALRVQAHDAAGDSVTQTILRAYALTS